MVQNKIGSLIVIHDPNPWVLSQYAPKRNPETFLATEQCKTCFNSHKVSALLDTADDIKSVYVPSALNNSRNISSMVGFRTVVTLSCSHSVYKLCYSY